MELLKAGQADLFNKIKKKEERKKKEEKKTFGWHLPSLVLMYFDYSSYHVYLQFSALLTIEPA